MSVRGSKLASDIGDRFEVVYLDILFAFLGGLSMNHFLDARENFSASFFHAHFEVITPKIIQAYINEDLLTVRILA